MKLILLLILAYLLGSIPSGVWIGKLFFKKISDNTGAVILERPIHFVY